MVGGKKRENRKKKRVSGFMYLCVKEIYICEWIG